MAPGLAPCPAPLLTGQHLFWSSPDEGQGRDGEGLLAVGVAGKGLPGTWQLKCCGLGGSRPLPQGAGWLWWEQTVFTPSPHTLPTLAQPIPRASPIPGSRYNLHICSFCSESPFPRRGGSYSPRTLPQRRTPLQEPLSAQVPSLSPEVLYRRLLRRRYPSLSPLTPTT